METKETTNANTISFGFSNLYESKKVNGHLCRASLVLTPRTSKCKNGQKLQTIFMVFLYDFINETNAKEMKQINKCK